MRTSVALLLLLCTLASCHQARKSQVEQLLAIPEPKEWILVIHPEGCKTCLESLYSELVQLPASSPGAIVILAKNTKTLRLNPLIEHSPIPLYIDEEKKSVKEGLVSASDQILLFKTDEVMKFDVLEYQLALDEIRRN